MSFRKMPPKKRTSKNTAAPPSRSPSPGPDFSVNYDTEREDEEEGPPASSYEADAHAAMNIQQSVAQLLGAQTLTIVNQGDLTCRGWAWPPVTETDGIKRPRRVLLICSRETGAHLNVAQVLLESVVLGARWMHLHHNVDFAELMVFHVNNQNSQKEVPARPRGRTAQKWANFHDFLCRQLE
ncbi:hypothetical protein HBH56_107310 [Parastagonospora nodorum]|uniref:Uncharacterized protein n=1 Tax=Phaeosphaeria nodorum (strain SN15 / ATCC MYA-4574 / FGSC 10173) TaxID=321614 RepID=A0A7U2FKH2_PHANO|nr:hypothetical protein HBH56_107310 [Parastagonospora nodorum]QRD04901.1 hypothetical protein JI435_108130 [Parastagonospora nodorum SN15]KAH3929303.1 hypothetical protein HBH54_123110 [Parastagonospora nodorum]KAH3975667.1 hypothetical protein HBH52_129680 [Parastagonospora nodorum]KAH4067483.1 hypothetical protein HBH50_127770 [Parastagonospora nodorum]